MGTSDIPSDAKIQRYQVPQRGMTGNGERPPLDPDARTFLDMVNSAESPPSYQLPVDQARTAVREGSPLLSLPGPDMAAIDPVLAAGGDGPIDVRLYTPPGLGDRAPLLIFFHGGGFVYCDMDTHDGLCRSLASSGQCKVASVDYRLAPEHAFPAACDDALAVTSWLVSNAQELGVDSNRIAIGGDSAGGNLAAGVAQVVPTLAGQLLIYPWLDMRMQHRSHYVNATGNMLTRAGLLWFRSHYLTDLRQRNDQRASPILTTCLKGLPPAFVLTAGYDPLRDEAADYARRLSAADVPVCHSEHQGQIHGFAMMDRVMTAAVVAVREMGDWLLDLWKPTPTQ